MHSGELVEEQPREWLAVFENTQVDGGPWSFVSYPPTLNWLFSPSYYAPNIDKITVAPAVLR